MYITMKYNIRDIIEYIIALVNEFAKRFGLTEKQAYRYIRMYQGVAFVEQHYGIMHTLDFDEAVDSVAAYCRKNGGELWLKLILTVWRKFEKMSC